MPIYEYECKKCGNSMERITKFAAPNPDCCKEPMKKLISKSSFALKGGGWYSDGYSRGCSTGNQGSGSSDSD